MRNSIHQQATSQRAFACCARFHRNAEACNVPNRNDEFESDEVGIPKPPLSNQIDCCGSNAPSPGARSGPLPKISSLVRLVEPVEPTTTQVAPVCRDDRKLECGSLVECWNLYGKPRPRVLDGVSLMTPRHPRLELRKRLPSSLAYCGLSVKRVRANAQAKGRIHATLERRVVFPKLA